MNLKVIKAEYIDNYKVMLTFNNDIKREVDLTYELDGAIFEPLKDIDYFKNFYIDCNTISWKNGADFAPEYLFLKSKSVSNKDIEKQISKMVYKLYGLSEDDIRVVEGL
jgi:hypothetical protein